MDIIHNRCQLIGRKAVFFHDHKIPHPRRQHRIDTRTIDHLHAQKGSELRRQSLRPKTPADPRRLQRQPPPAAAPHASPPPPRSPPRAGGPPQTWAPVGFPPCYTNRKKPPPPIAKTQAPAHNAPSDALETSYAQIPPHRPAPHPKGSP